MKSAREQEQYLMQQYFNGTFSDAHYDCTCSGNNPPAPAPIPNTGERTPTPVVQPTQQPDPVIPPTLDEQVEDTMNNQEILTPMFPEPDLTYPSNEFIEEPMLPSGIGDLASQSGASDGTNTLQHVEPSKPNQAGAWLLGLVVGGIALRQLLKKKPSSTGKNTGTSRKAKTVKL
jgi:hypothetical protein